MKDQRLVIDYDRVSVLTGAILLAFALQRLLETPAEPFLSATVLGSPLGVDLSASGLMLLIIIGMTITAVSYVINGHPEMDQEIRSHLMYWLVPGLLNLALAGWLNRIDDLGIWIAGLLLSAVVVPSALVVEYHAVGETHKGIGRYWSWQMALVHLTAAVLFTQIFDIRLRSLLSATAVAAVATALSARLFWAQTDDAGRAFRYGGAVGLILGQMTWGFNYWRLTGLQGGLLLLLVFYVTVGLINQLLLSNPADGKTGRRAMIEFGSVAILTLVVIGLATS
jgi:hypothetical protein